MAFRKVNDDNLVTIANAIRAKSGTSEPLGFPDGFVNAISAIQGGGATPSAKWNDVTFIDYDGSVLYSYSLEEAQALTELPALPSHSGLICQGWNWSLESIKSLNHPVTVGAMYITDDGATRLHIRIATVHRMTVPLYIGQTVENGVTINWGDGSSAQSLPGIGDVNTTHTYAEPGDYIISLTPDDGCVLSIGQNDNFHCILGTFEDNEQIYCNMLQSVFIGRNVTSINNDAFNCCYNLLSITIPNGITSIGNYAFFDCHSLSSITIPDSVTSIGYSFRWCYNLSSITIPNSVTSIDSMVSDCYNLSSITIPDSVTFIGDYRFGSCYNLSNVIFLNSIDLIDKYAFKDCYNLSSITIPDSVKTIGYYAFANCYNLSSIIIPNSVTSIDNYAFNGCYGMRYYDFSTCTSIPTLLGNNAFSDISSDCQMLIPSALFDEWSKATNWVTYAEHMVAV